MIWSCLMALVAASSLSASSCSSSSSSPSPLLLMRKSMHSSSMSAAGIGRTMNGRKASFTAASSSPVETPTNEAAKAEDKEVLPPEDLQMQN
eukprot:CAMPEP_0175794856 /NCGR_PEP_ID=MMETSP0097-20121207/84178_1 /TAXON_ID=311494 /ORGANISM="Alexandrium monilatum, Strain CCMP3105" /LENGTH=91 /DNA_ID=CAMNT_0017106049 /DNA_START=477 /DNA_END=751 /DNA_ORIENTATION=-